MLLSLKVKTNTLFTDDFWTYLRLKAKGIKIFKAKIRIIFFSYINKPYLFMKKSIIWNNLFILDFVKNIGAWNVI